ncbi:MAG: hypothetical protein FWG87_14555 [Defluviitaleaceae bacterium]|nr:hypothetical protein [Defluviitaleaceae bacterium]
MKKTVLVANTHKTIVRIADVGGVLSPTAQWQLAKELFPLGDSLNADTHVFDGSYFVNSNGQMRFFITALPVLICEQLTEIGAQAAGSVHRIRALDTAEHILFRKYTKCKNGASVIIFPHDDHGFRALYIEDGLPCATERFSDEPEYRENELVGALGALPLFSDCMIVGMSPRSLDSVQKGKESVLLLTCEGVDSSWVRAVLEGHGLEVREEELRF